MQAQIGVKFKNMNYLVRIQFPNAPLQECCQIVARSIADGWDLDLSLLVLSWTCAHCIYFYAVLHCLCALWSPAECITFCGTQQNLHTTLHLLQLYKRRKKMVNNERNSKKKNSNNNTLQSAIIIIINGYAVDAVNFVVYVWNDYIVWY